MARYIDADALLSRLPEDLPYKASVKRVLMQAPTAEVVEKLDQARYIPLEDELLTYIFENYKKTIVREIFEEIEKHLIFNTYGIATISDQTFAELKKKYTEDKE